jgi:hypothetical protein
MSALYKGQSAGTFKRPLDKCLRAVPSLAHFRCITVPGELDNIPAFWCGILVGLLGRLIMQKFWPEVMTTEWIIDSETVVDLSSIMKSDDVSSFPNAGSD